MAEAFRDEIGVTNPLAPTDLVPWLRNDARAEGGWGPVGSVRAEIDGDPLIKASGELPDLDAPQQPGGDAALWCCGPF